MCGRSIFLHASPLSLVIQQRLRDVAPNDWLLRGLLESLPHYSTSSIKSIISERMTVSENVRSFSSNLSHIDVASVVRYFISVQPFDK